ncbi:site-specific DNA-methyltransferase [candidate division KSB1 bacterium]|nr:MAG: site-specific DNA-methyltransferase [candidate division KSB1 bacterium]
MELSENLLNAFICGDCFEEMPKLPDECVDLVLTDPPYGIDYQSNRRVARPKLPKFENDVDLSWVDGWVEEVYRVLKPDRHFYCFTRFDMYPVFYRSINRFFKVKNCLIWVKNNHGSGDLNGAYAPQCEMIIYAGKGKRLLNGSRESDVLHCDNVPSAFRRHATQKPVELLRQLIEKSTEPGELVLDPFAGVGSTGLACIDSDRFHGDHHERNYLLFELNREFVEKGRAGGLGRQEILLESARIARQEHPKKRPALRTNRVRARRDETLPIPF